MAKGKVLMMLKEVIYMLYDEHGNKRVEYRGELAKRNLTEARIKLLEHLCDLVLNTDIVHDWTKIYLRNRNFKVTNVWEKLNDDIKERNERIIKKLGTSGDYHLEQEIDKMKVTNKIQYDQARLEKELGNDIMTEIIYQDKDIGPHLMTVTALLCKYKNLPSVRDNLDLDIRRDIFNNRYNGNFIEDYGSTLYTYLKETKKVIEQQLNENRAFVGYFNYLCSESSVGDKNVVKDRELLHKLLSSDVVDLNVGLELLDKYNSEHSEKLNINERTEEKQAEQVEQVEQVKHIEHIEQAEQAEHAEQAENIEKENMQDNKGINTEVETDNYEIEIDNCEVDIDISDIKEDTASDYDLNLDDLTLEDEKEYIYEDNRTETKENNIEENDTESEVKEKVEHPAKTTIRMQF